MGIKSFFKGALNAVNQVSLSADSKTIYGDDFTTQAGAVDNSIEQAGKGNKYLPYELKAVFRSRQDIKNWNEALSMALALYPINYPLQLLYNEIMIDAMLTSQIENRQNQVYSSNFNLKKPDGTNDDEQTAILRNHPLFKTFIQAIYTKKWKGNQVLELKMITGVDGKPQLSASVIPNTNIVQQVGLFYPDFYNTAEYVKYRELPEYGTWILEFDNGDLGLLNKAIPHVLFQRFAQSCWSELCEIYGIPPRVLKTNTQNRTMLSRAKKMMEDMGTAAWFIIDNNESFEWAKGMVTNGDVYKNLMDMCRDHICLLISGAIIGQDTKNGARSKDQSSQEMLWLLVQADQTDIENDFNNIILPALKKHGVIKGELTFEFEPSEDIPHLWDMTNAALEYFDVDPEWIKNKFGIQITGPRAQPVPAKNDNPQSAEKLAAKLLGNDFFRSARHGKNQRRA